MSGDSQRAITIYWNSIDGRFETFYKNYALNMGSYCVVSMDSFKVVKYIRKKDEGKQGYRSGGKKGDYIRYLQTNVVYDLSSDDKKLATVWKLVGWIVPFSYENIIINDPCRRRIDIQEYHKQLIDRTAQSKFNYFKKLCNSKKNIQDASAQKNPIYYLPDDIIDIIEEHCLNPIY